MGNEEEEIEDRLEYISVLFESYQCFRFFLLKKSKIKESKKRKLTLWQSTAGWGKKDFERETPLPSPLFSISSLCRRPHHLFLYFSPCPRLLYIASFFLAASPFVFTQRLSNSVNIGKQHNLSLFNLYVSNF